MLKFSLKNYPKLQIYFQQTGDFFGKIFKIIKSETVVGGISVSSSAIRFVRLTKTTLQKIGVVLEPGVIVDGTLKNKEAFLRALLALRYKLGNPREDIHVIISLPANKAYSQSFSLPIIEDRLIDDAAKLNLQLLSPIDIKAAYSDWEKIGETQEEGGKIELLGAFANKAVVDELISVFREAGFGVVAVEFTGLSLARLVGEQSYNASMVKPQVVLSVSSDGPEFIILKNNRLYFNYFVPWTAVEGRQISLADFATVLTREMKKVLNFYSGHWNNQLNDLVLITFGLYDEIEKIIKKDFPNMNIKPLILSDRLTGLNSSWYAALGGAIRGGISRSKDVFISLMDVGTERSFFESRVTFFVKIWRTIALSTLGALTLFFFLENLFFMTIAKSLDNRIASLVQRQESQEVIDLEKKAEVFNTLVEKALSANRESRKISIFLDIFNKIAGSAIKIQKVLFDSNTTTVRLTAIAKNNQSVIDFKNALASRKEFKNVTFSFTSTITNPDGTIVFPITLGVNM